MASTDARSGGAGAELRVLLVEDSADDAALLSRTLARQGLAHTMLRVDTAEAMEAALERETWDLVIADYVLPRFSGLAALEIVQRRDLELPFIVVSGKIRDETAVEAMKAGAHDYVFKENLSRLGPAVERELREARMRRERRDARAAAERAARHTAFLADASRVLGASIDLDETLKRIGRIAVPDLADWCFVHLAAEGQIRLSDVACGDPDDEAWARQRLGHVAALHEPRFIVATVLDQHRSMRASEAFEAFLVGVVSPAAMAEARRRIAPAFLFCAPLSARGCSFGTLTLVHSRSPRRFDASDAGLVEELARRAGMAIDNAMLLRDARRAVRLRDEFLSVASHELRTPVATLLLLAETLVSTAQRGHVSAEQVAKHGTTVLRQLGVMTRLIENLLDLSRIGAGRFQLTRREADLAALARATVEEFRPLAEHAHCRIEMTGADAPVVGEWDATRVQQVLINLLGNAAKYGRGKPIEVLLESEPSRVRLTVRDHGIGIAPADLTRIFERFERAVSTRHYGGLGLGLYISRQLVEAHGGTMTVESELGKGASFIVELPRRRPAEKAGGP